MENQMKISQYTGMLRPAALLLLCAAVLPAQAAAIYDTLISGDLTLDTLTGNAIISQVPDSPNSTSHFVDPTVGGTASASATTNLPASNEIQVQAATNGTAVATQDPIFGIGTTSFATGIAFGELQVTNYGISALTLLINIDISWAWTLLADNLPNEAANAALSLDLYADGKFVQSLINLVALAANGSDSLNQSLQIDLSDPLTTLNAGQSRTFELVASTTANATAIPEPGTLSLMLFGLAGIRFTLRRRALA
jgi:hypothetical protein